jgi:hypothetical protein
MRTQRVIGSCVTIMLIGLSTSASGELVRFELSSREPYQSGQEFGKTGAYDKIVGRAYFAIDPAAPANREIVDLKLAPRNQRDGYLVKEDVTRIVDRQRERAEPLFMA